MQSARRGRRNASWHSEARHGPEKPRCRRQESPGGVRRGYCPYVNAAARACRWAGVVPQQPPRSVAPAARRRTMAAAKSSGDRE